MKCSICDQDNKDANCCEISLLDRVSKTVKICEDCTRLINASFARQKAIGVFKFAHKAVP